MDWYTLAINVRTFTVEQALTILKLNPGATEVDIKAARKTLAFKYHADIVGIFKTEKEIAEINKKMAELNIAYKFLSDRNFDTNIETRRNRYEREWQEDSYKPEWDENSKRKSWQQQEEERMRSKRIPEWQTDFRSSHNEVGNDFYNVNYCKKAIYEEAIKHGKVERYMIWAFDGHFFRGVFEVFANEPALELAGKAMYTWNGEHYDTVAVFASTSNSKVLKLINLRGKPTSGIEYIHESFNGNPGNDQRFVRELTMEFEK